MEKFTFSSIIFIMLLLIILGNDFFHDKYPNIEYTYTTEDINNEVIALLKKKEQKITDKMIYACREGIINGCITGGMTGGFQGAIAGSILGGLSQAMIIYINESKNIKKIPQTQQS